MPERLTNKAIKEMLETLAIDRNVAYTYIAPLIAEINACWTDRMRQNGDGHDKGAELAVAYEAARMRYEAAEKELAAMTAERDEYRRDYQAELAGNGELRAKYGAEDREGFSAFVARIVQERGEARMIADKKHEALELIGAETNDFVSKIHDYLDRESVQRASTADGEYSIIQRVEIALKSRGEFALATRAEIVNLGKVQAQLVERVRELEKELGQERTFSSTLRDERDEKERELESILLQVQQLLEAARANNRQLRRTAGIAKSAKEG